MVGAVYEPSIQVAEVGGWNWRPTWATWVDLDRKTTVQKQNKIPVRRHVPVISDWEQRLRLRNSRLSLVM